jgi:hypothetical protein
VLNVLTNEAPQTESWERYNKCDTTKYLKRIKHTESGCIFMYQYNFMSMGREDVSELRYQMTYCSPPSDSMDSYGEIRDTGKKKKTRRKTCASATLSTTNPTRADQGTNPDLSGERPVTNRLSHETALRNVSWSSIVVPCMYIYTLTRARTHTHAHQRIYIFTGSCVFRRYHGDINIHYIM